VTSLVAIWLILTYNAVGCGAERGFMSPYEILSSVFQALLLAVAFAGLYGKNKK
jgi:hypothetical protein